MSAVQDDEQAQINGFVSVAYCAGFEPNILPKARLELGLESATLIEGIPFKIRGFHFCYDSPLLRPILAMMQMTVGYDIRVRTRTHYGMYRPNDR